MALGNRIAEARRGRSLSQEQLAEALGVSRQAISKWEGGQSTPELDKLAGLAGFFGVTADWLLTGTEPAGGQAEPPEAGAAGMAPVGCAQGGAAGGQAKSRMASVVIGSVLLLAGILVTGGIILAGTLALPDLTAWDSSYPSRLMFVIFYGNSPYPGDPLHGLGLGAFFVGGIALALAGVAALLYTFFAGLRRRGG